MASGQVPEPVDRALFLGELSLDGRLRHTQGILLMVGFAREHGFNTVYVLAPVPSEASLVDGVHVVPVESLGRLATHLQALDEIAPFTNEARSRLWNAPSRKARISATSAGRSTSSGRWKLRPQAGTTLSWSDRRARANVAGAGDSHDAARDDYG